MAFTYEQMMDYPVPEVDQMLTPDDCILYALGVGVGADPIDERQLRYVYEDHLRAFPTMVNVMGYPGFWLKSPDTGCDWHRVLHGEQAMTIHRPLPTQGRIIGRTRVKGIRDRGPEKGASIFSERTITDAATGEVIATIDQTTVARGDGGCGGDDTAPITPAAIPDREPDTICDQPILPQAALLYRLNGDRNPLHADPAVAAAAGFKQPILHGLCTLGIAGHAILATLCDYDADAIKYLALRFSAPVYPGETLRTEMWKEGNEVAFRALVPARDAVVLNNGRVVLAD